MATPIIVPTLGESISEALVARWIKQVGDAVAADEPIVELETDKITVEVRAEAAGVLTKQGAKEGDRILVGDTIAEFEPGAAPQAAAPAAAATPAPAVAGTQPPAGPSARVEALRTGVDLQQVQGSARGGRIIKEDVQAAAAKSAAPTPAAAPVSSTPAAPSHPGQERREPMSPLRRTIAARLVQAQNTAAILTTFNEVDMSAVMKLRSEYKDAFATKHGVKLGFMSFFTKATCEALKAYPSVNAEIRGDDIIYKDFYHVGVAVGGGKGLVVPVVRNADQLSLAGIEAEIARLAGLAKTNKLQMSDLTGGTFTISNGGVYGSMLSTPILNSPQTGILGLHNIVERPVAIAGKVEIRPIMYLALSYDHRLIDGREAVGFLIRIKECMEDPRRMLLGV